MIRYLSSRFWIATTVVLGVFVIAVAIRSVGVLLFGLPFLLALAFSAAEGWWPPVDEIEATLDRRRAVEGDIVTSRITVSGDSPWVEVEVQVGPGLEALRPLRRIVTVRGRTTLEFPLRCTDWGVMGPQWVTVTSRDRFGMTEAVRRLALVDLVRVHPTTAHLSSMLPMVDTRSTIGDHRSVRRGRGTELAEIRPHRTGEPARLVHGRASARRNRAMVADRHVDESADVVLYLDSIQDIGIDRETTLRWIVVAAMSLARRHLRSMDRLGVLDRGAGVRWLPPRLGRRAEQMIVDALLATSALRARVDDHAALPAARVPKGASVIALSPLLSAVVVDDLRRLCARGNEVIVIRPTRLVTDAVDDPDVVRLFRLSNRLRERELAATGAVIVPWDPTEPLEGVIARLRLGIGRMRVTR